MKRTLKELLKQFDNYDNIRLVIGQHTIDIIGSKQGSYAIIKAFEDKKFEYKGAVSGYLLLEY
ncbi:MAG: hypothetical protein Q4E61_01295 [Alphaproteobacteria bacterium]|nr:hypothetical protein [Alphaproteobacteria bacterium]